MSDVVGHSIAVFDGQLVNPFTVMATDGVFRVDTIAHALSNLCRYGGHTSRFYSVAEHCLLVEQIIEQRTRSPKSDIAGPFSDEIRLALRREALVHDANEAYLVDLPAPIKGIPEFAPYLAAEIRIDRELRKWFGIETSLSATVANLDIEIRRTERFWLFPKMFTCWVAAPVIPGIECGTMTPVQAKHLWLAKFNELWPDWSDK